MAANSDHALSPLIGKSESIATLTQAERRAVENLLVKTQVLKSGQDILCDGDTPSHCSLILEGWACRYKLLGEGGRQIFSFHIAGDIPDLQSLYIPLMDHSLGTLTATTVSFIPHEDVRDLTSLFPSIAAAFWRETLVDAAIFCAWIM